MSDILVFQRLIINLKHMREIVDELSFAIRTIAILLCKSQSVSMSHVSKKKNDLHNRMLAVYILLL